MQQHDTKLDTNPPQFDGGTELWDTGISPETKAQQIHSLAQSTEPPPPPPPRVFVLEFSLISVNSRSYLELMIRAEGG